MFNLSAKKKKKGLEDWQVTNVTPILKRELGDYRLLGLISIPGKLIEIGIKEKSTTKKS